MKMITSHVLGESEFILVFLNTKIGLLVNVLNAHMNPMIIVSFLYWLGIQYFQNTGNTFLELPPLTSLFNESESKVAKKKLHRGTT